jgi:hypothetical protein
LLAPSRHGRVIDVAVKLFGGAFGIVVGHVVQRRRGSRNNH